MICCEKDEIVAETESDSALYDVMDSIADADKKVDINIFKHILKQKDIIIDKLRDKINILNKQVELLNQMHNKNIFIHESDSSLQKVKPTKHIGHEKVQAKKSLNSEQNIYDSHIVKVNETVSQTKLESQNRTEKNSSNDLSRAIAQVETEQLMNDCININEEDEIFTSQSQGAWKEVAKKRKRSLVIENNKETGSVKVVPKHVSLHVYRLDPQTTVNELQQSLVGSFPEVNCEALNSKFPSIYFSFKVTFYEDNFKKVMDPEEWPYGACVNRFLVKHKMNRPIP
nr:uncharacterized protein LOC111516703 [Leptinotarsa decemlineata]